MDGVLQIKLARCTSKSNRYLQPSRRKWRARGPGTVPPLMLRFASCQPACQIRSIRRNNLKREGAHAWIASRNWIEKGKRTPAASPHPSGSDGSGGHRSSQVGSARLHLLMQTMLDGGRHCWSHSLANSMTGSSTGPSTPRRALRPLLVVGLQ